MRTLGIRSRIFMLIMASALPALGLIVYQGFEERATAEIRERENLQRVTTLAAMQHKEAIEGARQLLFALAGTANRLLRDPQSCNEYFRSLLQASNGLYHSLGILDKSGYLACNAKPWTGPVDSSDRAYFRQAISTGKFSIGEYQLGRVTGQKGVNFGHPARNAENQLIGVIFAGLSLQRLGELAREIPLPRGGRVTLFDRDGTILAQHPDAGETVGKKSGNQRLREAMLAMESGLLESTDMLGVPRLYAFQGAWRNPDGSTPIRVVVSIPKQLIYAEANRALAETLAGLVVVTLILLFASWYGTEVLVMRKFRVLLDMARRVSAGDLTARTGLPRERETFSRLGHALDKMAQSLEDRDNASKQAMIELNTHATTDPLTGLYNRRFLQDFLKRELLRAKRGAKPLAVIMLDLDHFKRFNDNWGHAAGDLVLQRTADAIRDNIRESDIACRYGGEELMAILPDASQATAMERAENIRLAIAAMSLTYSGNALSAVTASFGIAIFPEHGVDAKALICAADEALYEAKGAGRNRVMVSTIKISPREQKPSFPVN